MSFLLIAAIIAILPAYIANSKGRSFFLWWIYGVLFFLFALPHSLLIKTNKRMVHYRQLAQGMRKCMYCAEMIKQEAMICRFCGKGYIEQSTTVQSSPNLQAPTLSRPSPKKGMSINDFYREQRSGTS